MRPIIPPLRLGDHSADVANLQEGLLLLLDARVMQVSEDDRGSLQEGLKGECRRQMYGDFTEKAVKLFREQHHLRDAGDVDEPTAAALNRLLAELGAISPEPEKLVFTVEGRVASRIRAGVDKLRVVIVDKNVGGDVLLKEGTSNENGDYRISFTRTDLQRNGKQQPDLQARVFVGETFLGASEVRYNASHRETDLNVLLTEQAESALPSEHETLTRALSAHFRGSLRDLQETGERQDITYLANKTGWDARAVALSALADEFSAKTADADDSPAINPSFFYALFRAGLPANEDALYQTDAKTAATIWKQGIKQGVIPAALESNIPQALERFQRLAAKHILDGPALAGVSSLKEMLSVSLGDNLDPARQTQFAELYTRHRGEPQQFWEAVRGTFGEGLERRLKLDGQLGYLTLNNAPLIRKLHEAIGQDGLSDTVGLATNGYYRAAKWRELIGDGAIPLEITGNEQEKRARYTELLAAQVRLSFPTAVVAQMIKSGETPLAEGLGIRCTPF